MDVLITLFYVLFSICVVYPPTEFISAGFTIPHLFESYLGSENINFVGFHMKRMTITSLVHSLLPLGYVLSLWCGGENNQWMPACAIFTTIIPVLMCYKLVTWWENRKIKHPVVKALLPYVTPGSDWRVVASNVNVEFRRHVYCIIDKVTVSLQPSSKFVATETWLIKISQYTMNLVKQEDCSLVATGTDHHELSPSGENEVQYVNIDVIPTREGVQRFSFRLTTTALRELQPRLHRPVRVPDSISLIPTVVERFLTIFRHFVDKNPVHYVDEDPELCIGCMQAPADVKLNRRCAPLLENVRAGQPQCQECNCRVLWCCVCMARWWATRAQGPPPEWLSGRCTCPVCRAPFCILDVSPVALHPS